MKTIKEIKKIEDEKEAKRRERIRKRYRIVTDGNCFKVEENLNGHYPLYGRFYQNWSRDDFPHLTLESARDWIKKRIDVELKASRDFHVINSD